MMPEKEYFESVLIFSLFWVIGFFLSGTYSYNTRFNFYKFLTDSLLGVSFGFAMTASLIFGQRETFFSRLVMFYSILISYSIILLSRAFYVWYKNFLIRNGKMKEKIVLLGDPNGNLAKKFSSFINSTKNQSFEIVGIFSTSKKNEEGNIKILGKFSDLEKILEKNFAESLLDISEISQPEKLKVLRFCESKKISYKFVPADFELEISSRMDFSTFKGIPIVSIKPTPLVGWGGVAKRLLDIFGSIFGIITLWPVMIVMAIAIKLESKGPAIIKQKRIGFDGEEFVFFKFRSMRNSGSQKEIDENDKLRLEKLGEKLQGEGILKKIDSDKDPRVTKVGKFIRKTNLDELAQLFNVLIGTMSLVGPRPYVPVDEKRLPFLKYKRRYVKPGITGLWQISGSNELSEEEWLKLDNFYVENWSFFLDIQIIFKTIKHLLTKRGK